jgi:hypothetical protein
MATFFVLLGSGTRKPAQSDADWRRLSGTIVGTLSENLEALESVCQFWCAFACRLRDHNAGRKSPGSTFMMHQ